MALAVWQSTIVNRSGDVQPNAQVRVRLESSGALAAIYADRDGNTPLSNPFTADENGFARFYAAGAAYRIDVTLGDFSQTYRHQSIGLLAEQDVATDDQLYYRQTAAEITAGVTPTDYAFLPGDVRRYGAVADGVTDSYTAFYNACLSNRLVSVPQGAFYLSETLVIDATMAVRVLEGASSAGTSLYFEPGQNGIDIDREQFELRRFFVRPIDFEESGTAIVEDTNGVIVRRSSCLVANVFIEGFDIGGRQSSRYNSKWERCRFFYNNYNFVFGRHGADTLEPNNNLLELCQFEEAFKIGVDQREGARNVLHKCDLENLPGTVNMADNFANDTWGLKVANELTLRDCWLEGSRWFATESSSGILFDNCQMSPLNASGATRHPCRIRIEKHNPTTNLIALSDFSSSATGIASSDASNQLVTLSGSTSRDFGADVRTYTVTSGSGTSKVITNGNGYEFDPYVLGELLTFEWGIWIKKSSATANTRVEMRYRNVDDSEDFTESSARLHVPSRETTDWQHLGGYIAVRSGEFEGVLMRRMQMRLVLDESSADWSGETPLEVDVCNPHLRVLNMPVALTQ